jgi:hypothetical protein
VSELLLDHEAQAREAYTKLEAVDASLAAHGEADLAVARGRLTSAEAMLARGIASDLASGERHAAANKQAVLAEVRLRRGNKVGEVGAAGEAAAQGEPQAVYAAGEVLIGSQEERTASSLASRLA